MRKRAMIAVLMAMAISWTGCDSGGDNEDSIADLLADNWTLTGISDNEGDKIATFAAGFNAIDVMFTDAGDFTIDVDAIDDADDQTVSGSWAVNESQSRLTLTTTYSGIPVDLVFTYGFVGDDALDLTATSATSTLLNALLGTSLVGTVSITIERT